MATYPIVRHTGFTLIEFVSVLVILGVLSAVALPRFADTDVFASRGFFEESLSAVRYAHKLALASGCSVRVDFDASADRYALSRFTAGGDCNQPSAPTVAVLRPGGGGAFAAVAPNGVDVSNDLAFYFDRIGRPRTVGGALITAAAALQVSIDTRQIQIVPETGLVQGN